MTEQTSTKTLIHVEKVNDNKYKMIYENGVYFADAIQMADGFFVYVPANGRGTGYMTEYALRMIADELDKLNTAYIEFLKSQGMY